MTEQEEQFMYVDKGVIIHSYWLNVCVKSDNWVLAARVSISLDVVAKHMRYTIRTFRKEQKHMSVSANPNSRGYLL